MDKIGKGLLHQALTLLEEVIRSRGHPAQHFVVCGGSSLTISFISRYDQIFFKLYAATDQGGKHLADLRELKPSAEELLAAARWTCRHDPSDGFRFNLGRTLDALGNGKLAGQL